MRGRKDSRPPVAAFFGKGFILLFCIPILGVWAAGSMVCAGVSLAAAVLGLAGWDAVALNLNTGTALPRFLILPTGIALAGLLLLSYKYTRRALRSCLRYVKS